MRLKPTWRSFFASAAISLSPVAIATVVVYFTWEIARTPMLVASVLMAIVSLYLLVQDVLVHRTWAYADEEIFAVIGPLGGSRIRWSDVVETILKERQNLMTRTDHLLILRGPGGVVSYNTSTLSERDERLLLELVRSKGPLIVEQSKPCI
jgi:hypothetical protein